MAAPGARADQPGGGRGGNWGRGRGRNWGRGALTWSLLELLLLLHAGGATQTPPGATATPSGAPQVHPGAPPSPPGEPQVRPGVTVTPSGAAVTRPGVPGPSLQVRLVNGPSRCAGRVEVLHLGRWGTVCDDTWDLRDAQVICRYLGCGHALSAPGEARFGEGAGPIWLDGLRCTGAEPHLGACPARPWGQHTCNHVEDAGAVCSASQPPGGVSGPQVRLAGAPDRCAGRVELLHAHLWGTVCDDTWDLRDAQVICRYLGCGHALSAPGAARYGRGAGPIWLDDVSCTGEERELRECPARTWGSHNCHHGEDAAVVCAGNSSSGELRLVSGPHLCAGRVELLHEGQWGTVCDDGWDMADAQVACRQAGCGPALAAFGHAHFGRGWGRIWLDDVTCAGSELHLAQCPGRTWGDNNCHHGEDAAVVCTAPNSTAPPPTPPQVGVAEPLELRLAGGPSRCAGQVELHHLGRWGGVCGHTWDLRAAQVICRYLGCGHALSAPGHAPLSGRGPAWRAQVSCTGEELTLSRCQVLTWAEMECGDGEQGVQVTCAGASPPQVRLRGGPGPCSGQVQVLHNLTWLQVCGRTWGLPEARVLCRQLGCGPALSAPVGAWLPPQGAWLTGLTCDGAETQLRECRGAWPGGSCGTGEGVAAGVECATPRGVTPPCSYLVALLVLMTSLGGALLWLTLRARCALTGVSPPHLSAPRAPSAIYLPGRASPGGAEGLQLMEEEP